jgi:peroxisomal 3,2-trans-enoyl-CoA isomerase
MASDAITLETKGRIAIITLNREKKLNALDSDLYYRLATLMQEVAEMPNIYITILTGKGRFFSAYGAPSIYSLKTPC